MDRRTLARTIINRSVNLPDWWEGTVETVSPLRIRVRQVVPDATPDNLAGPLNVGAPVWGVTVDGRAVILGRFGGPSFDTLPLSALFVAGTPAQTPTAVRDGAWVQMEGAWQMAAGTSPVTPAISYNTTTTLLTLPSGWRPPRLLTFPSGAFASTVQMTADVRVATDGTVSVHVNNAGSGSTGAHLSLNAVRYRL